MERIMPMISYAQNFEDVMLWRALKHIEHGFYVDVGAQHPIVDSVSKAFYENGWRGIHIEPVPEYADLLRKDRPDETVLQLAISDKEGTIELNVLPDTGLSTISDMYAMRHNQEHGFSIRRIKVPTLTLTQVLHDQADRDIHWLKIDVEGHEAQVLKGWDSDRIRPWIIVVESTIPLSKDENYQAWESYLADSRYDFAYFDGLNRFYLASEHHELAKHFTSPPNVFDRFVLNGTATFALCHKVITERDNNAMLAAKERELVNTLETRVTNLQIELDAAKQTLSAQAGRTAQREHELMAANDRINTLEAQFSWLQNEWDAAKQRVESLSNQVGTLEMALSAEREQKAQRESELAAAREKLDKLEPHAQWLQNEWDAAKARIDELNKSSHHWWTVADGLNRELQTVYSSKSWRITVQLRKIMQAARWVVAFLKRAIQWVMRLPKRIAKPLILQTMSYTLNKPAMKALSLSVLAKFPKLKLRLRQSAVQAGLVVSPDTDFPTSQSVVPNMNSRRTSESADLSTRAAYIYAELKKAIEQRKG